MKDLTETSKYMAMLLRHKPEAGNITLDEQGYTDTKSLLSALNINMDELIHIIDTDKKGRYSFNDDKSKVRANQGHSVPYVHIDFKEYKPDAILYHGTAKKYLKSILSTGLTPQSRQYVHLSKDINTAKTVGLRHAKTEENLVVLTIDTNRMERLGHKFYISDNNVILVDCVPVECIEVLV